jgi:hypothetical protein
MSEASRRKMLHTNMWADLEQRAVTVAGGPVRSRELFRVNAPIPTTWRVLAAWVVGNAGNLGVFGRLVLPIGAGRITSEVRIDIAANVTYNFVVPGMSFSAFFDIDVPAVGDNWQFGATIAPEIPWEGMKVEIER